MPSEGGSSRHAGGGAGGGGILLTPKLLDYEGTRARPLKLYETEPFLTIGTSDLYTHRTAASRQPSAVSVQGGTTLKGRPGSGDSRHSGGQGQRSTPISAGAFLYSLFTSEALSVGKENSRSGGQTSPSRMPASSFTSFQPPPNPRIKMPFKHDIRKPSQAQCQEPAQELKEMTALATYHMTQMLGSGGDDMTKKQRGRLRKGKLKPLYPVDVTGPSIRQCRGILTDTRSYSASASRTLQRRRCLVTQLKSGMLNLGVASKSQLHDDTESVHRVSAASSVEDLAADRDDEDEDGEEEKLAPIDDFQAELASMERDALFTEDMLEDKTSLSKDTSASLREEPTCNGVTATSLSSDQGIGSVRNPDFSTTQPLPDPTTNVKTENEVDGEASSTEVQSSEISVKVTLSGKNVTIEAAGRSSNNEKDGSSSSVKPSDGVNRTTRHSSVRGRPPHTAPPSSKRPLSAGVTSSDCLLTSTQVKVRPQTANQLKTVRFADHAHFSDGKRLPVSRSNNWMGKGRTRRGEDRAGIKDRKNTSGQSCKPYDEGKGHTNDDDDDDDGDDRSSRKSGERGGVWRGRTAGSAGAESNKVAGQGGHARPASNSQSAPQDEVITASFSNHAHILHNDIGDSGDVSDFVDSSYTQHQQYASQGRNKERETARKESMSDTQTHSYTENKADSTVTNQYPDPQKHLFIHDSDKQTGFADDSSPPQGFGQETLGVLPVSGEMAADLQKHQENPHNTADNDTGIANPLNCIDIQGSTECRPHLTQECVDPEDKSDLTETLVEVKNESFNVDRNKENHRADFIDSKTAKLQQWWTLLEGQLSRWLPSVLVL